MISAWDTFFEVDDYYTYKKPVGHGAYGVVISALDTRDNSKVRENERTGGESLRGCSDCSRRSICTRLPVAVVLLSGLKSRACLTLWEFNRPRWAQFFLL